MANLTQNLQSLTIEFPRYGSGLLARLIDATADQDEVEAPATNIRLFTWAFANLRDDDPDVWIAIYISLPDADHTNHEEFSVNFDVFDVETVQGAIKWTGRPVDRLQHQFDICIRVECGKKGEHKWTAVPSIKFQSTSNSQSRYWYPTIRIGKHIVR